MVSLVAITPTEHQAPVFRAGVDVVNVAVTVTDKRGNLVSDLEADDFRLLEDGRQQTIRYFVSGDPATASLELHLGLLLDVSESMGEDIGFTKTAAIKFLNTLLEAVDVTVVDFDNEVRVARYEQNDFARLIERVRRQKAGGSTALYDAIGVYLDGAGGQSGRKIMLLYTDGGDTRSSIRLSELTDVLKASDVTIYAIGALEHQSPSTRNEQSAILRQIAAVTGGQAFFPLSVKQLDEVYAKLVAEIHSQYTIGYVSTNETTDGAWRKLGIKVGRRIGGKDVEYRVRSRKGYFGSYKSR